MVKFLVGSHGQTDELIAEFSSEWMGCFAFCHQEMLLRGVLDHFPISISTDPIKWGPEAVQIG